MAPVVNAGVISQKELITIKKSLLCAVAPSRIGTFAYRLGIEEIFLSFRFWLPQLLPVISRFH